MVIFLLHERLVCYRTLSVPVSEAIVIAKYAKGKRRNVEDVPVSGELLPPNYASGCVNAETDATITRYIHRFTMSPTHFVEVLEAKSPRCGVVFNGHARKRMFIECSQESVCFNMGSY